MNDSPIEGPDFRQLLKAARWTSSCKIHSKQYPDLTRADIGSLTRIRAKDELAARFGKLARTLFDSSPCLESQLHGHEEHFSASLYVFTEGQMGALVQALREKISRQPLQLQLSNQLLDLIAQVQAGTLRIDLASGLDRTVEVVVDDGQVTGIAEREVTDDPLYASIQFETLRNPDGSFRVIGRLDDLRDEVVTAIPLPGVELRRPARLEVARRLIGAKRGDNL